MTWAPTDEGEHVRHQLDMLEAAHRRARRTRPDAAWEIYLRRSWTLRCELETRSGRVAVRWGQDAGHAVRVADSGRVGFAASAGGAEGAGATATEALAGLAPRRNAGEIPWDGTGEILDLGMSPPPGAAWVQAELEDCVRDRREAGDACREAWFEVAVRHEFWVSDPAGRRARTRTLWSLVLGGPQDAVEGAAGPLRLAGRLPEQVRLAARPFFRWEPGDGAATAPGETAGIPWILAPEVAAWLLRATLNRPMRDPADPGPRLRVRVEEKPGSRRFVRGGLFDDAGFPGGRQVRHSYRDEPRPDLWGLEVAAGRRDLPDPCIWVCRAQQVGLPGVYGVLELGPALVEDGRARRLRPVRLAAGPGELVQWLDGPVGEARLTGHDVLTGPLLMVPRSVLAEK